ncbi:MAG: carboxypeptidase regulatory-like domain-containing protein [Candidatus Hydrogenedentes bacterium]|nr:carboxypeptidase regulatory-like domain-containing protein [Candidatus Hydrogenedentota bacterium]
MSKQTRLVLMFGVIAVAIAIAIAWLQSRPAPDTTREGGPNSARLSAEPPESPPHPAAPALSEAQPAETHAVSEDPMNGRVEGVVTWTSGRTTPPDAVVSLVCFTPEWEASFPRHVRPDRAGKYLLENLPRGYFEVQCGREAFSLGGVDYTGKVMTRQVHLSETNPVIREDFEWDDTTHVTGVVIDEGGSLVPDACVMTGDSARGGDATKTTADGSFELWRLSPEDEPSTYELTAVAPGYAAATTEVSIARGDQLSGVRIVLSRGTELRGRVIDTEGNPVKAAEILFSQLTTDGTYFWVHSDADGTYSRPGFSEGEYGVLVQFRHESRGSKQVPLRPDPLVIPPNVRVFQQDIVVSGETGVISGIVVNAGGEPLGFPNQSIFVGGSQGSTDEHGPTIDTFQNVEQDGRFRLAGFDSGPVELTVYAQYKYGQVRTRVPAGTQNLRITLPERVDVLIRIVDTIDGAPVPEATISPKRIESPDGEIIDGSMAWGVVEKAENAGDYRVLGVTPGKLTLGLKADGFVPRDSVDIAVPPEANTSVTLEMEPGAKLTLQVSPEGTLTGTSDSLEFGVIKGRVPDGEFLYPKDGERSTILATGNYEFTVFAQDTASRQYWSSIYTIPMGPESQEVVLPLGGSGVVEGTLPETNAAGKKVRLEGDLFLSIGKIQPPGSFKLFGIPAGSYVLRSGDYHAEIDVTDGGTTRVDASDFLPAPSR